MPEGVCARITSQVLFVVGSAVVAVFSSLADRLSVGGIAAYSALPSGSLSPGNPKKVVSESQGLEPKTEARLRA